RHLQSGGRTAKPFSLCSLAINSDSSSKSFRWNIGIPLISNYALKTVSVCDVKSGRRTASPLHGLLHRRGDAVGRPLSSNGLHMQSYEFTQIRIFGDHLVEHDVLRQTMRD